MIKKQGDKYVLYTKDGRKILGTHHTKQQAIDQEMAIAISMRRKSK